MCSHIFQLGWIESGQEKIEIKGRALGIFFLDKNLQKKLKNNQSKLFPLVFFFSQKIIILKKFKKKNY